MQPWSVVRIVSSARREALRQIVDAERETTAAVMPTRSAEFLKLKVEGIREAAEVLVVALLETLGRGQRLTLDEVLFEDHWKVGASGTPIAY